MVMPPGSPPSSYWNWASRVNESPSPKSSKPVDVDESAVLKSVAVTDIRSVGNHAAPTPSVL